MSWTVRLDSADETRAFGRALGRVAEPGTVVALVGDLGTGKTVFAQGVGEGLGLDDGVVSPTFVLVAEHCGRLDLLHADLYRVEEAAELEGIGFEEQLEHWPGVALVEWADRFPEVLPLDHLRVELSGTGHGRQARVRATGERHGRVEGRWRVAWAR